MLTAEDRDQIEFYILGRSPECPIMTLMRNVYSELIRLETLDRQCRENPTIQEDKGGK